MFQEPGVFILRGFSCAARALIGDRGRHGYTRRSGFVSRSYIKPLDSNAGFCKADNWRKQAWVLKKCLNRMHFLSEHAVAGFLGSVD
jgi:hypothetical protein